MTHGFESRELLERAAWVRRLARGLVSDASAADDLAQEAWVAALSSAPTDEGSLRNWMAGVLARLERALRSGRRDPLRRRRRALRHDRFADRSDERRVGESSACGPRG